MVQFYKSLDTEQSQDERSHMANAVDMMTSMRSVSWGQTLNSRQESCPRIMEPSKETIVISSDGVVQGNLGRQ